MKVDKVIKEKAKLYKENNFSDALQYHIDNDLGLEDSIFRLDSKAYSDLAKEVKDNKPYWSESNKILSGKSAWMAENLDIGKSALFKNRSTKKFETVKLDSPKRGGRRKFYVYRDSGKKNDEGKIIAHKIEWGDPNLSIKNGDTGRAKSFWARHQCDSAQKMNPKSRGFWACYGPSLFAKQLGISSSKPW